MKTLASLLGALTIAAMIAGCGPDMKTINGGRRQGRSGRDQGGSLGNGSGTVGRTGGCGREAG